MSFNINSFDKLTQAGVTGLITLWAYKSSTDTLSTIAADAYFNEVSDRVNIGDNISVLGSNGFETYQVNAVSPSITVSQFTGGITPGSIVNADIASNAAINVTKLQGGTTNQMLSSTSEGAIPGWITISGAFQIPDSGIAVMNDNSITTSAIADSAVTNDKIEPSVVQTKATTLTGAQFRGMYDTSVELIPAPGPNKVISVLGVFIVINYDSGAAYAQGGDIRINYGDHAHASASSLIVPIDAGDIGNTESDVYFPTLAYDYMSFENSVNQGIYIGNATRAYINGDSPVTVHVTYKVITTV